MARVDYDRMAPDYVEGRVLPPEGMEPWRAAIRARLPGGGAGGSPVLDLGAGTGQFAAAIAGWFRARVVAVEPLGGMRAQAAQAHPHPDVAWVAGVGERLPLGRGTCAWAWVSTVVHHLDDLDAVAGELGRVLRPGGLVLVRQAFPGRMDAPTLYQRFFPGAAGTLLGGGGLPTVERVSAAFAGAGFRVEGLQAVEQVSATSLAAYRDKVRLRADTGCGCSPTTSSPPGWPPSTGPPRPRPAQRRWSTASTCWSCAARPSRPAGPSGRGPGRRRPGPG